MTIIQNIFLHLIYSWLDLKIWIWKEGLQKNVPELREEQLTWKVKTSFLLGFPHVTWQLTKHRYVLCIFGRLFCPFSTILDMWKEHGMYANTGFLSVGLLTPQCRALFVESWKMILRRRGAKGAPAHHPYHGVYVCTIQPDTFCIL